MAVILYQIGIFLAIYIASRYGKKSRNTAIILITIFTILQVYMSWLLILQFITIIFSYYFSESNKNVIFKKNKDESYGILENNPILIKGNTNSYKYISTLNSYNKNLTYKKLECVKNASFEYPIDVYEFKKSGKHFCYIFIYPYSNINKVEIIPKPFQKI